MRRLRLIPGFAAARIRNVRVGGTSLALLLFASGLCGPVRAADADAPPRELALPLPEIPPFLVPDVVLASPAPKEGAERPREDILIVRGVEIPGFAMPDGVSVETPIVARRIEIETPPVPALNFSMLQVDPPASAPLAPAHDRLDLDPERAKAIIEPLRAKLKLRPGVTDELVAFHEGRGWAPLWLNPQGRLAPKAQGVLDILAKAGEDGLDSARLLSVLPVSLSEAAGQAAMPSERRAETELAVSLAAYAYAQDARGGRLEPNRLSSLLTPKLDLPKAGDVLDILAKAENAEAIRPMLLAFNPPHQGYRALRQALARLRAEPKGDADQTASAGLSAARLRALLPNNFMNGAGLNPGQEDARVPLMRLRLGLPATEGHAYDAALAEAVREFQRANGLKPDGRVTPRTRETLENLDAPLNRAEKAKAAPDDRIGALIANMERWRWLPQDLGRTHVFVNIPDFRLEMMDEGARIFETRVIVGKPERQTPVFSDQMEFLVVNPSWFIPPTILRKDVLPKLAADPGYAARMGYEVIRRGNSVSVRQPPGARNALGHVKFMFPNDHSVYLHDTPGRHLFRSDIRAFSSGCVRVESPFQLAEALLLKKQGLNERQLRAMVGGGERTIRLNEKIPVHLAYFTYQVDASGALLRKPDLYGHDARIRRALAL